MKIILQYLCQESWTWQRELIHCVIITLWREYSKIDQESRYVNFTLISAVYDLQSQYSPDEFFSIKPVRSDSYGVIPFVIRTHWKYTSWTKITFAFFAEDKDNIEAGYYQVDSGSLAGCISGKDIHVLLPFRTNFKGAIKALTFLHGFEITSNKVFGSNSPFEVQVINT